MASWERHCRPLEPWGVRQLPMERARLWLVDLLWGFSPHFEILRVPVKGSKGYAGCRQQDCAGCLGVYVFSCLYAGVCACVCDTPPPPRWHMPGCLYVRRRRAGWAGGTPAPVWRRVSGLCCGRLWVTRRERPRLSKCADMRVDAFAYTAHARACLYLWQSSRPESATVYCNYDSIMEAYGA